MKGHKKYNWMGKGIHKRNNTSKLSPAEQAAKKIEQMKNDIRRFGPVMSEAFIEEFRKANADFQRETEYLFK